MVNIKKSLKVSKLEEKQNKRLKINTGGHVCVPREASQIHVDTVGVDAQRFSDFTGIKTE